MLTDSALALAEACKFPEQRYEGDDQEAINGAYDFAKQLRVVMGDIASEFGEQPEQCAAITLFAVAGMVSDMYAIAADAGLCAVEDIPPHPMRELPAMLPDPQNRAQRRQQEREERRVMRPRTPLFVPPGYKARGAT